MPGQCHFLEGNTNAAQRVQHVKSLLTKVEIDPERVHMYNLSAAMGPMWAEICTKFTEKIKSMGPSPIWWADKERT
ncbi:MAG: hydrogenase iron-sulfur subunit [Deltaproteobacteria bacterium]|nr:hydrogenase iron-sulfur subunit [Deltaproteobacteria bacterium]